MIHEAQYLLLIDNTGLQTICVSKDLLEPQVSEGGIN